ncbi:hypothetical protein [Micromonospora sp. NPDC047740]|uniref:hypothetical protein n=1 Tax=Micromonospora sp. NPDC047740 TaxID=3364254 RepID=UPI003723CF85
MLVAATPVSGRPPSLPPPAPPPTEVLGETEVPPVGVSDVEPDGDSEADGDSDVDGDSDGVGDSDADGESDGVGDSEEEGDGEGDGDSSPPVPAQVWLRLNLSAVPLITALPSTSVQPAGVNRYAWMVRPLLPPVE